MEDSFKKVVPVRDVVKPTYDDDDTLVMSVFDLLLDSASPEGRGPSVCVAGRDGVRLESPHSSSLR